MRRTVFWSWQRDLPVAVTKDFIKKALTQALAKVSSDFGLEPADRFELDHDTKGEAGLVEIASTIFGKIDECDVFVGDVTPVARISTDAGEKGIPNANVMIELGYALRELGHQRVITVANLAYGGRPEELPFDLRHRRGAITYSLDCADNDPARQKQLKSLVEQLAAALKVNLAAPREDRLIKNPMPSLSLEPDGMPVVTLVSQNVCSEDAETLAEIKQRTPVKTKADQETASPQPFAFDTMPFGRRRIKPFREWDENELEGYNRRVVWYYQRYEEYLESLKNHQLLLQRAIKMRLQVVNRGTRPATDLRVRLTFPPNFLVYEDDDLPPRPDPPSAPPCAPHGFYDTSIVRTNVIHFEKPKRIADDRSSLNYNREKLQHHYAAPIPPFTVVLSMENDIKGFDVNYSITTDELPHPATGILRFEVERSES